MPNQETSVDQYRNGALTTTSTTTSHRKASFIENLTPNTQGSQSRKNSHGSAPPKPVKEEVLYRSKNIQLSEYTFSDSQGNQKSAEVIHKRFTNDEPVAVCEMPTTIRTEVEAPAASCCHAESADNPEGILSIAILKRHILCDCLILVKKYRPSLKSFVLEFPAKMVEHNRCAESDGNESDHSSGSVGDAAVQDVEDNTGYRSTKVNWVSPETAMDPELCDNKLKIVSLVIDGDDPIKNNFFNHCSSSDEEGSGGHQCTTDCMDDIEVIPVPVNGLLDRLNEYSRRNVVIDSRVYAFAIGLKKGERLAQSAIKPEKIEMPI